MNAFLSKAKSRLEGISLSALFGVEVFCGTGRLVASLRSLGLGDSLGVDCCVHKSSIAPTMRLDLAESSAQTLLFQILESPFCAYVHLGPPSGAGPIIRGAKQGASTPLVTRNADHPDGVPGLAGVEASRVSIVNNLYDLCGRIFSYAVAHGILITCENPSRSHMWSTSHWLKHTACLDFLEVEFQSCVYGGERPRNIRLAHMVPRLEGLKASCPRVSSTHVHAPWRGARAVPSDSAYPVELCRLWAELLVLQLIDLGAKPLPQELSDAQPKLHWAAQAATSVQIPRKRLPPLVKEWKEVVQLESSCPILPGVTKLKDPFLLSDEIRSSLPLPSLPAGCKVLRRETRGVGGSAKDQGQSVVVVVIDEDDSQVAPSPLVGRAVIDEDDSQVAPSPLVGRAVIDKGDSQVAPFAVIDKGDSQVAPSSLVGRPSSCSDPSSHPGEPSPGAQSNTHVRGPTSHAKSLVPPEVNSHPAEVFAHARLEANDVTRESIEQLIELLSYDGEEPARSSGAQLHGEFSWSSGAYVHGVIGRRQNTATFPWCTKLCAAFINRWVPDLAYTCISLVRNVKAPLHVDRNNAKGSENAVLAISDFSGGGLWVESKEGCISCPSGQQDLKGDVLEFQDRVIRFEPHLKHSTMPWSGNRVVLIAFTIQGPWNMPEDLACELSALGFRLPDMSRPGTREQSTDVKDDRPQVVHKAVVGVPWEPHEFIERAARAVHPKHIMHGLPARLKTVIDTLATSTAAEVGQHRVAELRKWVLRKQELRDAECAYKADMPAHCSSILRSKPLLLFQEMLSECGFEDEDLVGDISQGFEIKGKIPSCKAFRPKRTSASLTAEDLKSSARLLRKGIINSTRGSGDARLDQATMDATRKEVERKWLWGPIPEADLSDTAVVTRRFGIWQGDKCRPIDNFKESGINATTSAVDTITVHTVDCIASGISYRLSTWRDSRSFLDLVSKTWDLNKAYKNLPLHSEAVDDAFLCVYNPDSCTPEIYGQRVLPFGARASVHGFCRTSLGLWTICTSLFWLHLNVYFDDFIGIESVSLSRIFDLCMNGVLMLLGWDTASDKDTTFSALTKVLGIQIDLSECRLNRVYFENTRSRRDELGEILGTCIAKGHLTKKDGEKLRGRLQFAEAQISGKRAGLAFGCLSKHVGNGGGVLDERMVEALSFLRDRVMTSPPRLISHNLTCTWHLYVDASHESAAANPDEVAGIGGILYNQLANPAGHFSEWIGKDDVARIGREGSENPIFELECYAILAGLLTWKPIIQGCSVIVFTDNEAALMSMIRGVSKNDSGARLVNAVHSLVDLCNIPIWFERVNTHSNIADFPSRGETREEWGSRSHVSTSDVLAFVDGLG